MDINLSFDQQGTEKQQIESDLDQQSQGTEKQQIESDLERCDLHPIEPVKLRLPNYIRHSSPSPLRFATDEVSLSTTGPLPADELSPSTIGPLPADEPLHPRSAISPKWPRYRVSRFRRLSRCEILESSPTPLKLGHKMQHTQYLTRSRTRSLSPSLQMLTNLHLESGYLTRSQVKLWKQKGKQPCPIHGKIICRQLPHSQSTPKLQSGHAANHHQSRHSPAFPTVRKDLGKIFSNDVQHTNGPAAKYIPTPQRKKANSKKIETKSRRKSFFSSIRKLATRFQRSVSKAVHRRRTVDVCNSSNVEQASDVQWVELNSKQQQNYFKGPTEDLDSSLQIIRCFKAKKVQVSKQNPAKAHVRRLMKEKQKRALSTPNRVKRLSMLQSGGKMPLDKMHDASTETSVTLQQEGNGLDLKQYNIGADHAQHCPASPPAQIVSVNPMQKLMSPERHSPRLENQLPKIPPITIKETDVVTTKASTDSQRVPPLVISKIRTVINPHSPQHVETSSQELSCDTSRQTEASNTSSQHSQGQSISSSPTLSSNNIVTQLNTFASVTPRRRDYTWISPIIQSKVDKIIQEPTLEPSSVYAQTLTSSTTLPSLQLSPISPDNSQRQPALQPMQSPTATRQPHMKAEQQSATAVTLVPQVAQKSPMLKLSVLPISSQHQSMAMAFPTHPSSSANSASQSNAASGHQHVSTASSANSANQSNTVSVKTGHHQVSTASPMITQQLVSNVSTDTTQPQQVATATAMGKPPQASSDPVSSTSKNIQPIGLTGPQQIPQNLHPSCDTHQSALVTSTNMSVQEEANNFLRYFYKYGKTRKQMKSLLAKTLSRHVLRRETSTIILNRLIKESPLTQNDILTMQFYLHRQRKKQAVNSNQQSTNPVSSDRTSAKQTKLNQPFLHPSPSRKSDAAVKTSRRLFPLYSPPSQQITLLEPISNEMTKQTASQGVSNSLQSSPQMSDLDQQPSKELPSPEVFPQLSSKQQLQKLPTPLPVLQCSPSQQMTSQTSQPQQMSTTVQQPQHIPVKVTPSKCTPPVVPSSKQIPSWMPPDSEQMTNHLPSFQQMPQCKDLLPQPKETSTHTVPHQVSPPLQVIPSTPTPSLAASTMMTPLSNSDSSVSVIDILTSYSMPSPRIDAGAPGVIQDASFNPEAANAHHQDPCSSNISVALQDASSITEGGNAHSTNTSDVPQDSSLNTDDVLQDAYSNTKEGNPHSITTVDAVQYACFKTDCNPQSTTMADAPQDVSSNTERGSPNSSTISDVLQDVYSKTEGGNPHSLTTADESSNSEGANPHSITPADVPQDAYFSKKRAKPHSSNTSDAAKDAEIEINLHSTTFADVLQIASSITEETDPHSTTIADALQDAFSNIEGAYSHSTKTANVLQIASSNTEGANPHNTSTSNVLQDASSIKEGNPQSATTSDAPQDVSSNTEGGSPNSSTISDVIQDVYSKTEGANSHSITTTDEFSDSEGASTHSTTDADVPQDASSNTEGANPHSTNISSVLQDASSNKEDGNPRSATTSDAPQDVSSNTEGGSPNSSTIISDALQDVYSNTEGTTPHSIATANESFNSEGDNPHSITTANGSSKTEGINADFITIADVPQDASSTTEEGNPHSINISDAEKDARSKIEANPHSTTTTDVLLDASTNIEANLRSATTADVLQDPFSNTAEGNPPSSVSFNALKDTSCKTEAANLQPQDPHPTITNMAVRNPPTLLARSDVQCLAGPIVSRNRNFNATTIPAMIIPSRYVHQTGLTLHEDILDTRFTPAPKKRLFTEEPAEEDTNPLPLKKRCFSYLDYLAQNRAWTRSSIKSSPDVCTQCDGINEILHDTPHNLGRDSNQRPSERSPEIQLFSLMCSINSRTGGKPHLMAKDLVWRLFTIEQLYGNRFNSLDTEVTSRIQSIVMTWTDCDHDHWNKKCVPFINDSIRRLFNDKLRKYEHLLNHRCEDHVTSSSTRSALVPM